MAAMFGLAQHVSPLTSRMSEFAHLTSWLLLNTTNTQPTFNNIEAEQRGNLIRKTRPVGLPDTNNPSPSQPTKKRTTLCHRIWKMPKNPANTKKKNVLLRFVLPDNEQIFSCFRPHPKHSFGALEAPKQPRSCMCWRDTFALDRDKTSRIREFWCAHHLSKPNPVQCSPSSRIPLSSVG